MNWNRMFEFVYAFWPIGAMLGIWMLWYQRYRSGGDGPRELEDFDPDLAETIEYAEAFNRAAKKKKRKPTPVEPQRLSDEDKRLNRKYPYRSRLNSCLSSHGLPCHMMPPQETHQSVIYPFKPQPGVRPKQIQDMAADLAMACGIDPGRLFVIGVMAGHCVGIEIAKDRSEVKPVLFKNLPLPEKTGSGLAFCAGIGQTGKPIFSDIAMMPHLLIAGTTGAGKSTTLNSLICYLINHLTSQKLRLLLIDPKMVELTVYEGVEHLLAPISIHPDSAQTYLEWAAAETERRYQYLMSNRMNNIDRLPERDRPARIVVVIDEIPELISQNSKTLKPMKTLARLGRAAGVHVIAAAQNPTAENISGDLKSCLPARWSLRVNSWQSSRAILDEKGAETLIGPGDSLLKDSRNATVRVQAPNITAREIDDIAANHWTNTPDYVPELIAGLAPVREEISLYDRAVELCRANPGGVSQTVFRDAGGFGGTTQIRAIMEELHQRGVIGPKNGNKKRAVLIN